jgi:glycosyltransferase involved in cell wall biosynthesis
MISLVTPIYNEADIIPRLHAEVCAAFDTIGEPWEVVYVDDGSRDLSLSLLLTLQGRDPHVVIVELSRNWGHQPAVTAGLSTARGDAIIIMDGDLQDPPRIIPELVRAWQQGAEVVLAERRSRTESGLRKYLFPLFYKALGVLSDYPIPLNAGVFGLMNRQVVDTILRLEETNRYLPGLRAWIGFKTEFVYYDRAGRASGEAKQTLGRLLKYALDAIFSFSYKPLRITLAMGMVTAVLSVLIGLIFIVCRILGIGLFGSPLVYGYTSTLVFILLLSGVQLTSVGVLGEYIGRIYDEVKRRPLFVIRKVHGAGQPEPGEHQG